MLITARNFTTTQRLHSFKFTVVQKAVHSTAAAVRCKGTPFSDLVRMHVHMSTIVTYPPHHSLLSVSSPGNCIGIMSGGTIFATALVKTRTGPEVYRKYTGSS